MERMFDSTLGDTRGKHTPAYALIGEYRRIRTQAIHASTQAHMRDGLALRDRLARLERNTR